MLFSGSQQNVAYGISTPRMVIGSWEWYGVKVPGVSGDHTNHFSQLGGGEGGMGEGWGPRRTTSK